MLSYDGGKSQSSHSLLVHIESKQVLISVENFRFNVALG